MRAAQQESLPADDEPSVLGAGGGSQLIRGLRILERLSVESRSASEIAREFGVNRSTALRLLTELVAAGYVARDRRTKRYSTRPERFYPFIANHPDHRNLTEIVMPVLTRLQEDSGEAAVLGVPANGVMVYLAYVPSSNVLTVRERLGTVRPMHASALGKAWLAALGPADLDVELGRLSYQGGTDRAARGPLELRSRLEEVRATGYAIDRDETFEGGSCVAVPLRIGDSLIGAVGVSGPTSRLSDDVLKRLGGRIIAELAGAPAS